MENMHVMNNELAHWGIRGMKWGVRRYQNKDGSLTPAGKKRRAQLTSELEKLNGQGANGSGKNSNPRTKSTKDMTDEELRSAVNRLQLEKQYRDYYRDLNPKKVGRGKKFVEKLATSALDGIAEAGKTLVKEALINGGKEALGLNKSSGKGKS